MVKCLLTVGRREHTKLRRSGLMVGVTRDTQVVAIRCTVASGDGPRLMRRVYLRNVAEQRQGLTVFCFVEEVLRMIKKNIFMIFMVGCAKKVAF